LGENPSVLVDPDEGEEKESHKKPLGDLRLKVHYMVEIFYFSDLQGTKNTCISLLPIRFAGEV
jgi:hypothetical protein